MGGLMQLNQIKTMHWVFAGIGGLIGILAGIWVMWPKSLPLLVVDMNRAIEAPSVMLARSKLTHEEQLKIMEHFSRTLPEVIKDYGASHQVTLVSASVLSNFKPSHVDVTDELIALTITRIKHEAR